MQSNASTANVNTACAAVPKKLAFDNSDAATAAYAAESVPPA